MRSIPTNTQIFDLSYISDSKINLTKTKRMPNQLPSRRLVTNNVFFLNDGARLVILGGNNNILISGEYFDM